MSDDPILALQAAVESRYKSKARLRDQVLVFERVKGGQSAKICIFDLVEHPSVSTAYAWLHVEGPNKRGVPAIVAHGGRIDSAARAVEAYHEQGQSEQVAESD